MPRLLQARDCDLDSVQSILVVKPSSLGDIVHTLPAVQLIVARHPHIEIRWVANTEWTPLLKGHPDIDEIIPFPRREMRGLGAPFKFWNWSKTLSEPAPPDLTLDFQGLLRSALIARRSKAPLIAGLSDAREGARHFYHRIAQVDECAHAADRYLALVAALGIKIPDEIDTRLPPGQSPSGYFPPDFLLLHPFSRGEGKSLSPEHVRLFCEEMAPFPVVIAGRWDEALTDLPDNANNLLNNTSLPELIWLMEKANFTVSVDSGPMHMAAAISNRVLGIHTWSDPSKVGPYRKAAHVWKNGHILSVADWNEKRPEGSEVISDRSVKTISAWVKEAVGV